MPERQNADTISNHLGSIESNWRPIINTLDWEVEPDELFRPDATGGTWFPGARIDALHNLLLRHLGTHSDRIALQWEGEPGDRQSMTYRELADDVATFTAAMQKLGVGAGHRVALHTGWLPSTAVAMLACTGLGAPWTLIPVSLPVEALSQKFAQLNPTLVVTQDGAWRHGSIIPTKHRADDALAAIESVEHTIVVRRTGMDVAWFVGDHWYSDLLESHRDRRHSAGFVSPTSAVDVDTTLCRVLVASHDSPALLTSHTVGQLLPNVAAFHRAIRGPGNLWCAGDTSWVVSQWHGLLGPLLFGDTAILYEGTLDIPNRDRAWQIIDRFNVSTFLTAPSVMRSIREWEDESHNRADSGIRRIITAGEAVEPELKAWLRERFRAHGTEVIDGWGQVLLGGIVYLRHASATMPDGGLHVIADDGQTIRPGETGEMVLTTPLPGQVRSWEGPGSSSTREKQQRFGPDRYATGDRVTFSTTGEVIHHGRLDDLVSISGQLISLSAVENVIDDHPFVHSSSALVIRREGIGRAVAAVVVTVPEVSGAAGFEVDDSSIASEIMNSVHDVLGGLGRPRAVVFVDADTIDRPKIELAEEVTARLQRGDTWLRLSG